MSLHPFSYVPAKSVDEVNSVLAEHGNRARPLVGGTDLLVQLRGGRFELDAVVDIKGVPEANALQVNGDLRVGAAVPCARVYENEDIRRSYPGLIDSAELVGGIQIQSRASMVGNLCNAAPSADTIPSLIVHKAEAVVASAKGSRTVPVEAFCTGPGKTVLQDGEWVVELRIPAAPPRFGAAYERFIPRNEMDIAVAGAGSSVTLGEDGKITDARIALASVAPTPLFAKDAGESLVGKEPSGENLEAAAALAAQAVSPIADMRGTVEQRKHLSAVLSRRTLEKATQRARETR